MNEYKYKHPLLVIARKNIPKGRGVAKRQIKAKVVKLISFVSFEPAIGGRG